MHAIYYIRGGNTKGEKIHRRICMYLVRMEILFSPLGLLLLVLVNYWRPTTSFHVLAVFHASMEKMGKKIYILVLFLFLVKDKLNTVGWLW